MTDELLYEVQDRVAILTFNRPDRMNTITPTMLRQLSQRLLEADRDDDVRAIVITGAGRMWCAGLDVSEAATGGGMLGSSMKKSANDEPAPTAPDDKPASKRQAPGEFELRTAPPVVLHKIDTPTIAALNGGAAGYGLDLALGCDIRIAADRAKLGFAFAARGIVPESGGTWLLPRLVGWSKASELLFAARTIDATEALELGLVSKVVDTDKALDEAMSLAIDIAANAPLAVRASKRMMRHAADENLEDHVQRQYLALLPLLQTRDFREGLTSYVEKRPPEFEGR